MNTQELPADWRWAKIGEIAIVNKRNPRLRDLPDDLPVTFLPMAGVDAVSGTVANPEIKTLGEVRKGFTAFEPGDVLFAKITPSMENGKAAIAKSLVNDIGLGSTEFHVISAGPSVLPEWIFHFVRQESFRADAKANFSGTAGQLRVPTDFISSYAIPVPPLPEQKRIVEIIETHFTRLDAAEAALKRVQANLRRYRAAVLKAACEGRLVPTEAELAQAEGRTHEPAAALLERILAERRAQWQAEHPGKKYKEPAGPDVSGLPELPEGWCWASAEQLCYFITKGTTPSADKLFPNSGDVPFIKVYNLTFTGQLDFSINPTYVSKKTHTGELARSIVVPGDVLMNIVGPPLGKVSIVPDTFPEWNINQAIARFRTVAPMNSRYLSICLQSESILNWATTRAKATAGQFNLTLEICRELPIPLPPVDEQVRIAAEVEVRLSAASHSESSLHLNFARSDRLRQSILRRAYSGQLSTNGNQ